MIVLETERLILRRLTTDDGEFILELVNEPAWLEFIGDKGVRNLEDARQYILNGPIEMYQRLGFGLYLVQLKDGTSIGICGLIKRPTLEDVDIGFALLSRFSGKGYAYEAASAVMNYGREVLGMDRIVAITNPANLAKTLSEGKFDVVLAAAPAVEGLDKSGGLQNGSRVKLVRVGVGVAIGMLCAPAKGEELRSTIAGTVQDAGAKFRQRFSSEERAATGTAG